jgi:hypothetical protein
MFSPEVAVKAYMMKCGCDVLNDKKGSRAETWFSRAEMGLWRSLFWFERVKLLMA